MKNLKYKTERQLKARVYELAMQNKKLLDILSFNIQDLAKEDGLTAEECKAVLERTMKAVKESGDANS